jgi:G:T-mismatch repair DNA endonuclease (very short patch repair protein)
MKRKVAVFVDGDFWHGNPKNFRIPHIQLRILAAKDRKRDREINKKLQRLAGVYCERGN